MFGAIESKFLSASPGAYNGSFYDPAKLNAAQAGMGPTGDGRKIVSGDALLSALNPLQGLKLWQPAVDAQTWETEQGPVSTAAQGAVYKDTLGRTYRETAPGQVQYFDNSGGGWQNPTSGGRDRVQPVYKLDANGNATPISSGTSYKPSGWVSSGRTIAELAAAMATAGVGGAALAGAGAGAEGLGGAAAADWGAEAGMSGAIGSSGGGGLTAGYGSVGGLAAGVGGEGSAAATAGSLAGADAAASAAPAYMGVGTAGAGAAGEGAGALASAGSSPGFFSSLANGDWGGAASSAGNWATSSDGIRTLGGLASSLISSNQANKGLNAQVNATNQSNALQRDIYNQNRADWAPYRALGQQGTQGVANLLANPSSVMNDPGNKFQFDQGVQAVDRSAAGAGGLYSGATLKALQRYGQNTSASMLDRSLNRFSSAAQLGATGTSGSQNGGANYANQVGNNLAGLGNAQAGNALYQGNQWQNALNGAVSTYTYPRP